MDTKTSPQQQPAKPEGLAGLRMTRWNATRSTWVSLYDGVEQGLDTTGGRWQVVCEAHGSILSLDTLAIGLDHLRHVEPTEWCEDCRNEEDAEVTNHRAPSYNERIVAALRVDHREAAVIEQVMRAEEPTLDAIDRDEFVKLAKRSQEVLGWMRDEDPDVARVYEQQASWTIS